MKMNTRVLLTIMSLMYVDAVQVPSGKDTDRSRSTLKSSSSNNREQRANDATEIPKQDVEEALRQIYDLPRGVKVDPATAELLRVKRNGDDFISQALSSKAGFLESLKAAHSDYGAYPEPEKKSFNVWGFKKAIFGTLLQAVKAITGGVIALKGQLIKVTGHITATKGKVLATKGDVISELGRHIASKALAHPFYSYEGYGHSAPSGPAYGYHHGYGNAYHGYPSAPAYGPPHHTIYPSAPAYDHYSRSSRQSKPGHPAAQLAPGVQAGLLVLKPVPAAPGYHPGVPQISHNLDKSINANPHAHALHSPHSLHNAQIAQNYAKYQTSGHSYQVNANPESLESYESQESRYQYPSQPIQNNYQDQSKRSPIKRMTRVPSGPVGPSGSIKYNAYS